MKKKRAVEVITDPEKAKLLVDPMRREMLRLLANRPMTGNELAEALGLSNPSVSHHLAILKGAGLTRVVRREAEQHGILQKFYETSALAYFIDSREMPTAIERYFIPVNLERAHGVIAGLNIEGKFGPVATNDLEQFAKILASTIVQVALRHPDRWKGGREELVSQIYRDALTYLLEKPDLFTGTVRDIFLRAGK